MLLQYSVSIALTLALYRIGASSNDGTAKSVYPASKVPLIHQNATKCPSVWYKYSDTTHECQCISLESLDCKGERVYTDTRRILTYDSEQKVVSATKARYKFLSGYNITSDGHHLLLPNEVSKLNEYICGPMNREDYMCGKCKTGFGPAVMLQSMPCADVCYFCKDT